MHLHILLHELLILLHHVTLSLFVHIRIVVAGLFQALKITPLSRINHVRLSLSDYVGSGLRMDSMSGILFQSLPFGRCRSTLSLDHLASLQASTILLLL